EIGMVVVARKQAVALDQNLADLARSEECASIRRDSNFVAGQQPARRGETGRPRRAFRNRDDEMTSVKFGTVCPKARRTRWPIDIRLGYGKNVLGHGVR